MRAEPIPHAILWDIPLPNRATGLVACNGLQISDPAACIIIGHAVKLHQSDMALARHWAGAIAGGWVTLDEALAELERPLGTSHQLLPNLRKAPRGQIGNLIKDAVLGI